MASNRIGRINEEIQRELAALLRTVKDPRVVLNQQDGKEVIRGLKSAGGYLRRELGQALSLRYTPELLFQEDDSIDKGTHILKLLNDIERKETGGNP